MRNLNLPFLGKWSSTLLIAHWPIFRLINLLPSSFSEFGFNRIFTALLDDLKPCFVRSRRRRGTPLVLAASSPLFLFSCPHPRELRRGSVSALKVVSTKELVEAVRGIVPGRSTYRQDSRATRTLLKLAPAPRN